MAYSPLKTNCFLGPPLHRLLFLILCHLHWPSYCSPNTTSTSTLWQWKIAWDIRDHLWMWSHMAKSWPMSLRIWRWEDNPGKARWASKEITCHHTESFKREIGPTHRQGEGNWRRSRGRFEDAGLRMRVTQPKQRRPTAPLKLEEARKLLPWSLWRKYGPAHPWISAYWYWCWRPGLQNN